MREVKDFKNYKIKEINNTLRKSYMIARGNSDFASLANKFNLSEEEMMKNTSKLENTVEELSHCKGCRGLGNCKNRVIGFVSYPKEVREHLVFSYVACKYEKNEKRENTNQVKYFETPKYLKEASLSEVFVDDQKRKEIIKYIDKFIKSFNSKKREKGLYLNGSFGSGKSYLISALLNELSKMGYSCVNIYYPTLLKKLKDSFDSGFKFKLDEIMQCDCLLIDDIGAENNTAWSRDEILGSILQYRMDNELSTFFTSNFTLEELEDHLTTTNKSTDKVKARRIIERIKQLSNSLVLASENKRN
ncbi:MAG: primosomal protein DnaI [Bacilli bacterium]